MIQALIFLATSHQIYAAEPTVAVEPLITASPSTAAATIPAPMSSAESRTTATAAPLQDAATKSPEEKAKPPKDAKDQAKDKKENAFAPKSAPVEKSKDAASNVPADLPVNEPNHAKPELKITVPSLQEDQAGRPKAEILDLNGSVERAIHEATIVQKSFGDVQITGDQLVQAYAELLPNLTAIAGYNWANGTNYYTTAVPTVVDSRNRGPNYQLSSTLNLFNGMNDLAAWKASNARKEAANLSLTRAKQLIALDVAQTFLQVILDQEIIKIAEKNLVASQAREALLAEQTRVGVRNLADLFRQQALTSSDETYLVNAQSKERADELNLIRKLRLDTDKNYRLVTPELATEPPEIPEEFADETKMIAIALEHRADLRAADETARAAAWDITASRSQYFPKLDLGASVSAAGRMINHTFITPPGIDETPENQRGLNDQLAHQVNTTVGLTLTWTLFDRWSREANIQRSRVNARNSRLDAADRRLQVAAEIRQAYGDYRAVLQQMESSKKGYVAAEKAFEVVQGRYQVGSSNFVDLSTAQAAEVQASANRAQALIGYALQTRALKTALGTLSVE